MGEPDSLIEVLKEIRDEIRALRTELGDRGARMAASGIRTEVVERGARWRIAATAGAGAMALVALLLALRTGGQPSPTIVETAPQLATAATTKATTTAMTTTPVSAPGPMAQPAPALIAVPAAFPLAAKTAPGLTPKPAATRPVAPPQAAPAVATVPRRQVKPAVAPNLPTAVASDEDEAMAFPPQPRRVRVHRMSYGPIASEPAKL